MANSLKLVAINNVYSKLLETFNQKMEKESKSTQILRMLYFSKKKLSGMEISNKVKISINQVHPSAKWLVNRGLLKKESLNGHYSYYWIPENKKKDVEEILTRMELENEN